MARPSEDDLTSDSQVKLRAYRWFFEPDDSDIEADPTLEKLTTFDILTDWFDKHSMARDLNGMIADSGRVEVGTLKGTHRTVYATFDTGEPEGSTNLEHVAKHFSGAYRIRLIAMPCDHSDLHNYYIVSEEEMTDQYGLAGFHACAKVVDWTIVDFGEHFQGRNLPATHGKIARALEEGGTWC